MKGLVLKSFFCEGQLVSSRHGLTQQEGRPHELPCPPQWAPSQRGSRQGGQSPGSVTGSPDRQGQAISQYWDPAGVSYQDWQETRLDIGTPAAQLTAGLGALAESKQGSWSTGKGCSHVPDYNYPWCHLVVVTLKTVNCPGSLQLSAVSC